MGDEEVAEACSTSFVLLVVIDTYAGEYILETRNNESVTLWVNVLCLVRRSFINFIPSHFHSWKTSYNEQPDLHPTFIPLDIFCFFIKITLKRISSTLNIRFLILDVFFLIFELRWSHSVISGIVLNINRSYY